MIWKIKPSLKKLEEEIKRAQNELTTVAKNNHISSLDVCAELITPMAFGGIVGYFIDKKFATIPLFMIILFMLGVIARKLCFI